MSDCIFCRIAKGEIPATKLHDDEQLFAIEDIAPAAPTHALIIPKKHVPTLLDLGIEDQALVGRIYGVAAEIARARGLASSGYRVVANCNRDGGQTVFHVHFHLLAGRPFAWPPG
jgi:histidine triad (HIT) family protein